MEGERGEEMKTETLPSTINSGRIDKRVLRAAYALNLGKHGQLETFFEHRHWWVRNRETGRIWDAVDAEGGPSVDGFDFEEVV